MRFHGCSTSTSAACTVVLSAAAMTLGQGASSKSRELGLNVLCFSLSSNRARRAFIPNDPCRFPKTAVVGSRRDLCSWLLWMTGRHRLKSPTPGFSRNRAVNWASIQEWSLGRISAAILAYLYAASLSATAEPPTAHLIVSSCALCHLYLAWRPHPSLHHVSLLA